VIQYLCHWTDGTGVQVGGGGQVMGMVETQGRMNAGPVGEA